MSGGNEELQELSQQIQAVESQLEALQSEVRGLRLKQSDIDDAIKSLETLETGTTVHVPIGGNAFVRASVDDIDEVIVGVGADYATERTEGEAIDLLEDRQDQLGDRIEELTSAIAELEAQGQQLGQRAQQQLQQLQEQGQLPQRGQGPGPGLGNQ